MEKVSSHAMQSFFLSLSQIAIVLYGCCRLTPPLETQIGGLGLTGHQLCLGLDDRLSVSVPLPSPR